MVIFGVALGGAMAADALLWSSRAERMRAAVIAVACAAAPLISPLGLSYWPQVLETVSVSRELQIQEYRMPFTPADFPFWVGLAAFITALVQRRRVVRELPHADRVLAMAALVLAVAAVMASRNIAFFAAVAAPALSRLWPAPAQTVRRATKPATVAAWGIAAAAAVAAVAVVLVQWRGNAARLGWEPMTRETVEAVSHCPDPLFNHLEDGGFLMWALPDRRVFVDSRMEAYPLALLRKSRDADLNGSYVGLFREYGIRCAVTASGSVLGQRLTRDPEMKVVHTDARHTVFSRSSARASTAR